MRRILLMIYIVISYSQITAMAEDKDVAFADDRIGYWFQLGENLVKGEGLQAYKSTMDSLDISVVPPTDFNIVSNEERGNTFIYCPDPQYKSDNLEGMVGTSMFGPVFESNAADALIAYPLAIDFIGMSPDRIVESELFAAKNDDTIDISPLVSVIKDSEDSNADWIIKYEYDVANPQWRSHNHCVALALRKKNHYAFPIKIFLNDEGLKQKDKYIGIALKSVSFGNQAKQEWIEKENQVRADEGVFPMEKPFKCQHNR